MKNTSEIVRSKKNKLSHYTCISNEILQSKTLSTDEKSVLVHILSLPETWVINKTTFWKQMNIGRERFYNAWSGLEKQGHIASKKIIGDRNLIVGYHHAIYEEPLKSNLDIPVSGETENQLDQKPVNIECNEQECTNSEYTIDEENNINRGNIRTRTGPVVEIEDSIFEELSIEDLQAEYLNYSSDLFQLKSEIIKAAKSGTNVMRFIENNDLPTLERAIGNEKFAQIMPLIEKYFTISSMSRRCWEKLDAANKNQNHSQPVNEENLSSQDTG